MTKAQEKNTSLPPSEVDLSDLSAPKAPTSPAPQAPAPVENPQTPAEKSAAGREVSLRYYERKKIVLTKEKHNLSEIIFIKTPKGTWWKAFERSAIYFLEKGYTNEIGSRAKLQVDEDYRLKSKLGFVSNPNIEKLSAGLQKVGLKLVESSDQIRVFKMPKPVTEEEFNELHEKNMLMVERANSLVVPKLMMPKLFEDAKELGMMLFRTFSHMTEWTNQTIGLDMTKAIMDIVERYVEEAKSGGEDPEKFLLWALHQVDIADGKYAMLSALRIVDDKKLFEIAEALAKLRAQIGAERKRLAIKKIDDEMYRRKNDKK